jgi:hypothetical protein
MASGEERRMLFDIRGRRKNVIRVVYACLALLMGASLFVAVGPFNIAEFLGTGGSSSSAAEVYEEQAERIERRLAKNPNDPDQLLRLTRVRLGAGQALAEQDPATGTFVLTPESVEQYELGHETWDRYLKQAGNGVNSAIAGLVATTFFNVAEQSEELGAIEENIEGATKAQRAAAEASPNLNTLSTLAIYEYFNGEFKSGDETAKRAAAEATSKSQRKSVDQQLASTRKRAESWQKRRKKFAKQQAKAGKENLENPFGGLSGSGTTLTP